MVLPIITKLFLFNASAGLGTENIFFRAIENKAETMEPVISASHTLGAYTIKRVRNDKKIKASPNCVRLYSVLGNCDNFELTKMKQFF